MSCEVNQKETKAAMQETVEMVRNEPKLSSSGSSSEQTSSTKKNSSESSQRVGNMEPEQTLEDIGYSCDRIKAEGKCLRFPQTVLDARMRNIFQQRERADLIVYIADSKIECHQQVLRIYCTYFQSFSINTKEVRLPQEMVQANVFEKVYEWMLADDPKVQRVDFVAMLSAAYRLGIDDLIAQCWMLLNNETVMKDQLAFKLYVEAREYGLDVLKILLQRLGKFFLTAVATKEFLDFSHEEVIIMLSSSAIGVNSEIEVFMCAVRWITYKWDERRKYVSEVFGTVRFSLLPSAFLYHINAGPHCWEEALIMQNEIVPKIMEHFMQASLAEKLLMNDTAYLKTLVKPRDIQEERQWIMDPRSQAPLSASNHEYVHFDYTKFNNYLIMLCAPGQNWRQIKFLHEVQKNSEQKQWPKSQDGSAKNAEVKKEITLNNSDPQAGHLDDHAPSSSK